MDDAPAAAGLTPTDDDRFAATQLFERPDCLSRQEEDIALAAELLNSGLLNDRELAAAVSDWSLHGSVRLADHLASKQLLSPEQLDRLRTQAGKLVDRARRSIAGGTEAPAAGRSLLLATLERLDGSGRVAKLLGVTVAARSGDDDARVMQGRYELVRKLGQGGLGRVWLARDVNLKRYVALKEISHAADATDAMLARFRNEAEITGRLDHPSIVPIYQLGEDIESGRLFYTMRFLGKSTLQDSISEYHERREEGNDDPMLLRHLLTAFVNVCHAIGHAHSRRVIHRDLKPENVVIDSFGQVIVIDWGLAKVIDDTSVESFVDSLGSNNADRTSEGQVLGTPLYMAPEQAAGRLDELDERTDIYGLGAILFAIITGFAPHERTQKQAVDSGVGARGMISVIASGMVPRARDVNAEADAVLEAVCQKAMARRRYARYQQATDLAEDVQRWMAGERVSAYTETPRQRVARWVGQHQRLSQTLLAVATIGLVALATTALSARHNHVVALETRYKQVTGDAREVVVQMRDIADELSKDARFVAELSPMAGVIAAREGVETEDEAEWRARLENTFMALLRAKSDYLALSLEAIQGEGAEDVVRVERNPTDPTLLRVLPSSRLRTVEASPLMNTIKNLEPGDVRLTLDPRPRYAETLDRRERLTIATPVFSGATGKCFGMAVIEADIARRVADVLVGLGTVEGEFYIADGEGQVWAFALPGKGASQATPGTTIPNLPAEVAALIAQERTPFDVAEQGEYVATRFYVDPQGRGVLVFARLADE